MQQVQKLSGHRKPITCADCANTSLGSLLATGSEDKTVRLWDLRSERAWKSIANSSILQQEIGSILLHDTYLYCSNHTNLFVFDIRNESLLIKQPSQVYENICGDDINYIAINADHSTLAVSDDNGAISLIERFSSTGLKKLQGLHTSIAGSIAFHPSVSTELTSGGFDCIMGVWDTMTRRVKCRTNFSSALGSASGQQFLNPPFVQAVGYLCDGQLISCALGDGSIRVYGLRGNMSTGPLSRGSAIGSLFDKPVAVKTDAHGAMITCMHSNPSADWILTGGVDKKVKCWRVSGWTLQPAASASLAEEDDRSDENQGKSVASAAKKGSVESSENDVGEVTAGVAELQVSAGPPAGAAKKKNNKKKKKGSSTAEVMSTVSIDPVWSFEHRAKINIIKCFEPPSLAATSDEATASPSFASGVFIADAVSSDIYIYQPSHS